MLEALLTLDSIAVPSEADPVNVKVTHDIVHGDVFSDHSKHKHSHGGDEALPNLEYWLRNGTAVTRLEFASPPAAAFGSQLTVTGEQRSDRVAVSSYRVDAAAGGSKGPKG